MTKEHKKTSDYQDILSTEDCVLDALMKLKANDDTNNKNNKNRKLFWQRS